MVGNRVLQQVEDLDSGIVIEMEVAATAERGQEVGGGGAVPRVQMERCEIVDQTRNSGATEDSFKPDRPAHEGMDPTAKLRRLAPMPQLQHQQFRISLAAGPEHARNENRQLVDDKQKSSANVRQAGQSRLEPIRSVFPVATDCVSELDPQHLDVDTDGHACKEISDGARERERLDSASITRIGGERSQDCGYAVGGAVALFDVNVEDIPILARRVAKFQHHAGLAYPSGGEHQDVLALLQPFPDSGEFVVPSVEVVSDDGLPDDVAHPRFCDVGLGAAS